MIAHTIIKPRNPATFRTSETKEYEFIPVPENRRAPPLVCLYLPNRLVTCLSLGIHALSAFVFTQDFLDSYSKILIYYHNFAFCKQFAVDQDINRIPGKPVQLDN
jgi:hypothetical protein